MLVCFFTCSEFSSLVKCWIDCSLQISVCEISMNMPCLTHPCLIPQIPSELESQTDDITNSSGTTTSGMHTGEGAKRKKLLRKPSKKLIANGMLLVGGAVGGAICLSRGHSALGAKVALAYFLSKMRKRGAQLSQTSQNAGI